MEQLLLIRGFVTNDVINRKQQGREWGGREEAAAHVVYQ